MSRKGAVPIIVMAIGILMLIYMYFLPVSEKCKLIPSLPECQINTSETSMSFVPGLLNRQDTAGVYLLKDVKLFNQNNVDAAIVLKNTKTERGWFYSSPEQETFSIQENGKDARLLVSVNRASGNLRIYINGKKVAVIRGAGDHLIPIDVKNLEAKNTIKIIPTIPWLPFSVNSYEINKITLKEDYTFTQNRISYPFAIKENPGNILDIKLILDTDCLTDESMSIWIGKDKIIDDKICNGLNKDITDAVKANNMAANITFASEGNYYIDDIMFDVRMKESNWPTYYFSVSDKSFESQIMLKMQFNETGTKKLTAYINGIALSVDTVKKDWQSVVNKYLNNGTNSILLIPEETVTITKLEIK